ncbi:MAG: LTA synthase family protein [Clostridia bacterium]|nr:LTA synthase family protein [Clostridia bacterium]
MKIRSIAQTAVKAVGKWIKKNILTVIYFLCAVLIEMIGVWTVEGSPFMMRPFISLGLLLLICGTVLLIDSERIQLIVYASLLAVQAIVDLVFAVIFDMTEQYFDFGMFKLRNDAFGTLENIPINFITFYTGFFFVVVFLIYGLRKTRNAEKRKKNKHGVSFYVGLIVTGIATTFGSLFAYNPTTMNRYKDMIEGKATGAYAAYGMVGNFVNEMAKATLFVNNDTLSSAEMDGYIYREQSQPTEYFGVAKNKNLVVVLVESFEWFSIFEDDQVWNEGAYPNGLKLSNSARAELFPNLYDFYKKSVAMTNFHSREKTDISEVFSIMGSYPTGAYVNYDYEDNVLPYTVPNIMKNINPDLQARSFHNGWKSFYNRETIHDNFGFEYLTDMHDMEDMAKELVKDGVTEEQIFTDYYTEQGERNLDSEMVQICKDSMFPTDKQFCTYITTITMHGMYYHRDNIADKRALLTAKYMEENPTAQLDENGEIIFENEPDEILFNYISTVLDFDLALGYMMQDLEQKQLLDDTTIVLFGDHNTYYHELSSYTKGIYDYNDTDKKFTDLYSVPFMIYDSKLEHQIIDKFTCTADIVPTLLDLMGIRYYTNMYYGTSVFSAEESVLYSRAYDVFIGDGIWGKSVNNPLYLHESVTAEKLNAFQTKAKALVEKIQHCDYLFRQNYFSNAQNYATFIQNMRTLNNW